MTLEAMPFALAICRLEPSSAIPSWATHGIFFSVSRTPDELSVVCEDSSVPDGVRSERGWRCLKVRGPLDFGLTGILASLATPLAEVGVSIFAISTFDTDYVLVQEVNLPKAINTLKGAGHEVNL